ncbi:hypothetical protein HDV02_001173 [Globomyces sp. JEL0801]|nr:hypothetical protein HDV02_001173 [Globomyces sp. JEL0801]
MGNDSVKKASSYIKSFKNLPSRFKTQKSTASLESADSSPKGSKKDLSNKKNAIEQNEDETDTVAPGKTPGKDYNPKLVVRSTISNSTQPPEDSALSDPNTAPQLVYLTSYGGNLNYPLVREETHIGRKDDNHIVLTDATISKFHAIVFRKKDSVSIMDRNSSNGVRVNEQFIVPGVPTQLRAGDGIMVGSIKLLYYDSLAAIPKQPTKTTEENLKLVTILPFHNSYDEKIAIKAEIEEENVDFKKVDLVTDVNVLREDYEKLRLAYELSKITLTNDLSVHLEKSLDLIFEILPVDRGVVLLVDQNTGTLATQHVKLRTAEDAGKEIVLSSTILKRVYETRKCLVTNDASQDKSLQAAASVMSSQMRTVICVPLVGHNKVHGIIHLDANYAISNVSLKDLSIVTTISNQTAIAIENSILMAEYEQNTKVKEQLSRFLAPHVIQRMSNPSEIIRKGGRQLEGTVIFVDIRGFTNMSEKSTPVEVVHLLNDYFERLVRIVFKYNGVVDKYIGDALMCVFGTLEDDKDAEYRAVTAAFEFKQAIYDMNEDRARFHKDPISIGIGVNTGDLLAGFIGSSQRLEYTVIGDSVNTSSRLCSMSSNNRVLISEYTYKHVKDRIESIPVGPKQFKGKQKEVMVYEVLGLFPNGNPASLNPTSEAVKEEIVPPQQPLEQIPVNDLEPKLEKEEISLNDAKLPELPTTDITSNNISSNTGNDVELPELPITDITSNNTSSNTGPNDSAEQTLKTNAEEALSKEIVENSS